jgi:transcription initiation factor TFIIB
MRVGAPMNIALHDKGLSTIIDWRDKDGLGKKLSPRKREEAYRLRKWQVRMRIHSSLERNLTYAMNELDRFASQLGIQKTVKDTAAMVYRRVIQRRLIRGRSIESMMAASIYAACRMMHIPHTLDEITKFSRIQKKELGRCFRLIIRELSLHIGTPSPVSFLEKYTHDLHVSVKTQHLATRILEQAKKIGATAGKDPIGLAGAALYIAGMKNNEHHTQREIAKLSNITEVTIRNRYKELIKILNIGLNPIQ